VRIELSGGIGNQLFQYSLGNYLNHKSGIKLTFISAPVGRRETSHKSQMKDFHFGNKMEILDTNQIAEYFSRVDRYLGQRLSKYNTLVEWCFRNYSQIGVGFDERVIQLQRPRRIRGYFQSYLYAEEIRHELVAQFELVAPSDSFLS
jgi:hypothetical protein